MQEDAELVDLALSGDQAAFAELYERYFDRVYDFLARMVHNRDEAADLAQDTFVRALNNLPSLTKGGSFKSWLFTIARNTALNRLERSSRMQPLERRTSADDDEEFQMDVIDEDRYGNPEEAAQIKSYATLVWEAARSLPPAQYAVLDCSVRQGMNTDEMAEVLGVSKNNAYVMVNRMKKALEDAIGSLVLLREGRRQCNELNAVLESLQVAEMTPDVRKAIDRHAAKCDICSDRRKKLASPFGIFAGFGLMKPALGVKESIFEGLSASFAQTYGGGAAQAAVGAPSGGGASGVSGIPAATGGPLAGRTLSPAGAGGNGGTASTAGKAAAGGDGRRWGVKLIAAGVGSLLLLGGAFLTYSLAFEETQASESLVLASLTPDPSVVSAAAAPSQTPLAPLPTATGTSTSTPQPTATETPVETPTPDPAAAPPATEGPAVTDGGNPAGGPTASGGGNLAPPPSVTPVPPSVTPVPPTATSTSVPPTATFTAVPTDTPTATATRTPTATPTPEPCSSVSVSPAILDFGASTTEMIFIVNATACTEEVDFTASPGQSWISVSPASDTAPAGGVKPVEVEVDRNLLPMFGLNESRVVVSWGDESLNVIVKAVK